MIFAQYLSPDAHGLLHRSNGFSALPEVVLKEREEVESARDIGMIGPLKPTAQHERLLEESLGLRAFPRGLEQECEAVPRAGGFGSAVGEGAMFDVQRFPVERIRLCALPGIRCVSDLILKRFGATVQAR